MSYSTSDLVQSGYGLRPDATRTPSAYAQWLSNAQQQAVIVNGSGVAAIHAPKSVAASSSWSGCIADQSGTTYVGVGSDWNVPPITTSQAAPDSGYYYYSFWTGIGGYGDLELIQDGQYGVQVNGKSNGYDYTEVVYWAFTEYTDNGPVYRFNVNPNDSLFASAWVGDSVGNYEPTGGYGWFYLYDASTSPPEEWYGSTPIPSGEIYHGGTAEWIMEAPGNHEYPLADYNQAVMSQPWSEDTAFGYQTMATQPLFSISMYTGSTLDALCYCNVNNGEALYGWAHN
jgi:hypothetical protein